MKSPAPCTAPTRLAPFLSLALLTAVLPVANTSYAADANCFPAPEGLVGWWRGEGDGSDVTGNNDGILVEGLAFGQGLVGEGFQFTAPGQHLFIPSSAELAVTSLTIEAWINPATLEEQPIVEYSPTIGRAGVHLWMSVDPQGSQSLPGSLSSAEPKSENARTASAHSHHSGFGGVMMPRSTARA